jgi:pimeloyl-ACP methyl ester carboxylesterase
MKHRLMSLGVLIGVAWQAQKHMAQSATSLAGSPPAPEGKVPRENVRSVDERSDEYHAKVVILKNTGHWVLEENPKGTTDALMNFL